MKAREYYNERYDYYDIENERSDIFKLADDYAEQQIKELEEDVKEALRFAEHRGYCATLFGDTCGCGLDELLNKH